MQAAEGERRRVIVKGGTVVNADRQFKADVYCEDGIIRYILTLIIITFIEWLCS